MPSLDSISVSQLSKLIGTPSCPAIIDVRLDADVQDDPALIPGSFRHPFDRIDMLAPDLDGSKAVIVCQKGKKLSQGAAAILRNAGLQAEILEGGALAWRDADLPMVPIASIANNALPGPSRWVTRHRPKIDRIACPWLIRRFVDCRAQFLFVAPAEVLNVAEKFNAIPFDIEGVELGDEGDLCSFDKMLAVFDLQTQPLLRLARIIRGADTDNHDLAPECAGLLAASLGLSRMYRDDLKQLDAGMLLYDAFYRWARDAHDEKHDVSSHISGVRS